MHSPQRRELHRSSDRSVRGVIAISGRSLCSFVGIRHRSSDRSVRDFIVVGGRPPTTMKSRTDLSEDRWRMPTNEHSERPLMAITPRTDLSEDRWSSRRCGLCKDPLASHQTAYFAMDHPFCSISCRLKFIDGDESSRTSEQLRLRPLEMFHVIPDLRKQSTNTTGSGEFSSMR